MRIKDTIAISSLQQIANLKNLGYPKNSLLQAIAEVYGEAQTGNFKTWKLLSLGTGLMTAGDFRHALKTDGHRIGDWANDILGKPAFTATIKKTEVELVMATVAELGFNDGATRKNIYERAMKLSLALCPPEVGPQLRLQYKDQPMDEWLFIAMEPISGSGGRPHVFCVGRDEDGSWLDSNFGRPGFFWFGGNVWVFIRRK